MRSAFWWDVVEVIIYSRKVTADGRQVGARKDGSTRDTDQDERPA
jgi:hypothetical protein